jgi:hypothetical protein
METKQTVYNILAAKSEPVKVELALIDNIKQLINFLEGDTNEVIGLKKEIKGINSELQAAQSAGIQKFKSLLSMQGELESKLKELGLQIDVNPLYKNLEAALQNWSDANSLKV